MDANRRARIAAILEPNNGAHDLIRELLVELDRVERERDGWRSEATSLGHEADMARSARDLVKADADRLANWIIRNPTGDEAARTELLNLHDRP